MQKPKHWQGEWHDRLTKRRKKRKKCPANYFRFYFLFFRYIFTLFVVAIRENVCLLVPFTSAEATTRDVIFVSFARFILFGLLQFKRKKRRMQIKFIYYAFLFIWCILCFLFFSRSLASSATACHCAQTRTVFILAAHI